MSFKNVKGDATKSPEQSLPKDIPMSALINVLTNLSNKPDTSTHDHSVPLVAAKLADQLIDELGNADSQAVLQRAISIVEREAIADYDCHRTVVGSYIGDLITDPHANGYSKVQALVVATKESGESSDVMFVQSTDPNVRVITIASSPVQQSTMIDAFRTLTSTLKARSDIHCYDVNEKVTSIDLNKLPKPTKPKSNKSE